jgi:hypothetical protein
MNQDMTVSESHLAAIGALPKRDTSFAETALRTASLVAGVASILPFVGTVALPVSFGLEYLANGTKAGDEKDALATFYRTQIATQLGIDPSRVSSSDLELAASVNPAIARAITKIEEEKNSANTTSLAANAAGALASALPIPGAGPLAKMAITAGGAIAGGAVTSWLMSPDALKDPQVILENLIKERASGRGIAPIETFMLRVAQNSELQQAIKEKTGSEYYALTPQQQAVLMQQFPRIAEFAVRDADFLNRGGNPKELMFILPDASKWSNRVAQVQSSQGLGVRG